MQQDVAELFSRMREALGWAPDWAAAVILLAAAALIAISLHAILLALLNRTVRARQSFFSQLLNATAGPTRLALIIFAFGAALQAAPLAPEIRAYLTQLLLLAFIALAGWIAMIAVDLGASLYLS